MAAEHNMANRIQLRRDTTSNWNSVDPVLADGEPGYDIVTNEIRIGNGSNVWSELSANTISGGGASTGNITFSDYTIIGTGNIYLQPDVEDLSTVPTYLDVFVTTAGGGTDIHLVGGNSSNLILGEDSAANVRIGSEGNVQIQASPLDSTTYTWTFGSDGDLTFPDGTINSGGTVVVPSNYDMQSFGNILIQTSAFAGAKTWTFGANANLTLPANGTVSYSPNVSGDWANPAPTTIQEALDRLATLVKALNSGTGA